MKGHECYHCKQWVAEGEAHDCWTTTEAALTRDLSDELQDAWERLREAATGLGEQRVYASHHSIMFARKAAYFFVRPKRNHLEVVIFLGRAVKAPQIKKVHESSRIKRAHVIHVRHRDEVESPITDWLREAYALQDQPKQASRPAGRQATRTKPSGTPAGKKKAVKKKAVKKKKR
jgi:hypothetical protein